jgi:hypothetical protein
MKRASLFLLFIVALSSYAAAVPADFALPVIVDKPLLVTPGVPLSVFIYNGGHQVWSDFSVRVADGSAFYYYDVLDEESYATVSVAVPLVYLLNQDSLSVSLYYQDRLLDTKELPVVMSWAPVSALVDVYAPGGPEAVVLLDASQFENNLGGVQVEFSVLQDEKVLFFDYYGPFYLAPDERFVWRAALPKRYLSAGEYTYMATFYEGDALLSVKEGSFVVREHEGFSFGPLLLFIVSFLLLILLYLLIDMFYHGRSFYRSFQSLSK